MANDTAPPQLCAEFDKGGGVSLQTAFAIYSIVSAPPCWSKQPGAPLSQLEKAAEAVATTIPIYSKPAEVHRQNLFSLPYPPARDAKGTRIPQPPWFLMNAAIAEQRCIVAGGNIIEALLVVLRRPWCVLELCCCDYRTINAMLDFALLALQINPKLYSASVLLLSHEKATRKPTRYEPQGPTLPLPLQPSLNRLKEVYAGLSSEGMRSHNPFWLRLICICGVHLGIAFSELILALDSTIGSSLHFNVPSTPTELNLVRSSTTFHTLLNNNLHLPRRGSGRQSPNPQIDGRYLISLYKEVLQRLTEHIS